LRTRFVSEVMTHEVVHTLTTASIWEVAQLMNIHQVSCTVIIDPDTHNQRRPLGLLTARDIVQLQALKLDIRQLRAGAVMNTLLATLSPQQPLWEAHQAIQRRAIRQLIVMSDQDELIGIVSPTSLLQILDPVKMFSTVQRLKQRVGQLEAEQMELLQSRNAELERQVEERTQELQQQKIALRQERNFVSAILSVADALVVVMDRQGRIVRFNQACERISGYRSDEVVGQYIWDLFLIPENIELVKAIFAELRVKQIPIQSENYWVTRDGHRRLIAWSDSVIADPQGEVEYIIGTGIDITDRKQAEEALQELNQELEVIVEERTKILSQANRQLLREIVERKQVSEVLRESQAQLQDLFDNANDLMQSISLIDNRFIYVNRAWRETLGYSEDEIKQLSISDILHPDCRQNYLQILDQLGAGTLKRIERIEVTYLTKNGDAVLLAGGVNCRYSEGRPVATRSIFRDVTAQKQAQQALQESEAKHRALLNDASDAILQADTQGNLIEANRNAEMLLGLTQAEICQMTVAQIHPPQEQERLLTAFDHILLKGSGRVQDTLVLRNDGAIIPVDITSSVIKYSGKRVVQSIIRDISDRKQAEHSLRESQQFMQSVADSSPNILYIYDLVEYRNLYTNREITHQLGYSPEDIQAMGSNFLQHLVHPEDLERVNQHFAAISHAVDGEVMEVEYRIRHVDGQWHWFNSRDTIFKRDPEGQVQQYIGTAQDISERKRSETKRRQAEENIRNALAKEKELNDLKSRFVSMTSHEFRTPLAVIASSAGILKDFSHKLDEAKKQKHLQTIQTYVKHTTQLLDDILLINKAEAGKLAFEPGPLDLAVFCRGLVDDLQISAPNHQLNLTIHTVNHPIKQTHPIEVCVDKKLLRQILTNLLSNSVKYSPEHSLVSLDLRIESNLAVFQVKDKGIGIPPEDLPKLFESFHRAQNVGNIQGTGLGLSITQKCAELHGGHIKVSSEVGVGTTFTVIIPFHTD
ncbi:MAG: PAS domain S-box protein, partial [Pseudanabaenales cyanobacterium]|nr:PAS domain S-box protein [Pseudanabaenales cyanobacterium]